MDLGQRGTTSRAHL